MGLTEAPEHAREHESERSGRGAEHPGREPTQSVNLVKLLGFSSLWRLVLVLTLEIAVAFFALAIAVVSVSDDLPVATFWQRLQVLFSSRPTTLGFLFVLSTAIVVPTFMYFHVTLLWSRILWRHWRAAHGQSPARGSEP